MKKILAINVLALFVASGAFAEGTVTISLDTTGLTLYGSKTDAGTDGKIISKTSTGVGLGLISDANGYAVITQHKNGTKAFGTSHDSTAIFVRDVTKGTEATAPDSADSSDFVADSSGWTTM